MSAKDNGRKSIPVRLFVNDKSKTRAKKENKKGIKQGPQTKKDTRQRYRCVSRVQKKKRHDSKQVGAGKKEGRTGRRNKKTGF